jgi:hypothetical protein
MDETSHHDGPITLAEGDKTVNPWSTLTSREVYDNAWIHVVDHQVLNPIGNPGIYGIARGWCLLA